MNSAPRIRAEITPACLLAATIPGLGGGVRQMAAWGIIVVTALLLHELGHALATLAFGSRASIVLHVFGGVTTADPPLSRRRSLLALGAGPLASLALALSLALVRHTARGPWLATAGPWLTLVMFVHLIWGLVNLLPILPFDGGRVVLTLFGPAHEGDAWMLSASAALALMTTGLLFRSLPAVVFFGIAALASARRWLLQRRLRAHQGLPTQLESAKLLLSQGRAFEAVVIASEVALRARGTETEPSATEIVAWGYLELGQPKKAEEALGRVTGIGIDPYCRAAVDDACGRTGEALEHLEALRNGGDRRPEIARLLIDLCAREGDWARACGVAHIELHLIGPDDARLVLERAFDSDSLPAARSLAAGLFEASAAPDDGAAYASILSRLGDRPLAKSVLSQLAPGATNELPAGRRERLGKLRKRPELEGLLDNGLEGPVSLTTNCREARR